MDGEDETGNDDVEVDIMEEDMSDDDVVVVASVEDVSDDEVGNDDDSLLDVA